MPTKTTSSRGPGRPPIAEGADTVPVTIRMTAAQRAKLALLGGAQWIRDRIDRAKVPDKD